MLELEVAGFGASGRSGGWVLGVVSGSRAGWVERGEMTGILGDVLTEAWAQMH